MSTPHVAFVTGAGRGIGAAIAQRLAQSGVAVILGARSQEATSALASAIVSTGGQAWPVYVDVSDPQTIAQAIEYCRGIGPVDWLINNAGIAISAPFLRHGRETGEDLYERHLGTNFHGARHMIEALVPAMISRGYGRVVNVASSASLQAYPYTAAYTASKHALLGYGRSAALDLGGTGVTLNTLCPHFVDSPMTDETVQRIMQTTNRSEAKTRAFLAAQNPGGVLVTVEEVAELAHELLESDRNGSVIELCGGAKRHLIESGVASE